MAMYDSVWKEYCLYVLASVESVNYNWAQIELGDRVGIGLLQWSHSRSYKLLKLFYDDNPSLFTVNPMKSQMESGGWTSKTFTIDEANNVSKILQSAKSVELQTELWNRDITDESAVLKSHNFTDPKTAIFAETGGWLGGIGTVARIVNACGGGRGTTIAQYRQALLNDGTFGGYVSRWNKVYDILNKWDGSSPPPDFGQKKGNYEIPTDGNPSEDQNVNTVLPDPDTNEEIVEDNTSSALTITSMQLRGNVYHLIGVDSNGTRQIVQLFKEGVRIWTPNKQDVANNNSKPIKGEDSTPTPDNPNTTDPPPIPTDGTKVQNYIDLARSYVGKLSYSQELDTDRFSFSDGYADCSSFVVTLYYMITEKKLYNSGGEICSWTGNLRTAGNLIASGSGGYSEINSNKSKLKAGDLILTEVAPQARDAHVGIVSENNTFIHCKGTAYGTVEENLDSYINSIKRLNWRFLRIL